VRVVQWNPSGVASQLCLALKGTPHEYGNSVHSFLSPSRSSLPPSFPPPGGSIFHALGEASGTRLGRCTADTEHHLTHLL